MKKERNKKKPVFSGFFLSYRVLYDSLLKKLRTSAYWVLPSFESMMMDAFLNSFPDRIEAPPTTKMFTLIFFFFQKKKTKIERRTPFSLVFVKRNKKIEIFFFAAGPLSPSLMERQSIRVGRGQRRKSLRWPINSITELFLFDLMLVCVCVCVCF